MVRENRQSFILTNRTDHYYLLKDVTPKKKSQFTNL